MTNKDPGGVDPDSAEKNSAEVLEGMTCDITEVIEALEIPKSEPENINTDAKERNKNICKILELPLQKLNYINNACQDGKPDKEEKTEEALDETISALTTLLEDLEDLEIELENGDTGANKGIRDVYEALEYPLRELTCILDEGDNDY
jgi:hypothetical protein